MLALAGSVLVDMALLSSTGLHIGASWALIGFLAWGAVAVAACRLYRAPVTHAQRVIRDLVEGVSLFGLVSLLGAIASYPLAAGHHALVDAELERADLSLHFHWLSWYELVAKHAWLQIVERAAYHSIFATPALLIGYFAWHGQLGESRRFLATFWLAAVMTLALFPFFPAAGPFATLWHGSAPYMPISALYQDQVILALRQHRIHAIDLGALHGLVCAPSFHAASAVIYAATAFRVPPLRWPLVALNIAMLLATPIEGTHYVTDLLSGIAVAGLALVLMPILIRWSVSERAGRLRRFDGMHPVAAE